MDPYTPSMDSCNQPFNFTELLSSQQNPESFSSQVPLFSTQLTDDHEPLEDIAEDVVRRRKWTATEDVILCSAWLNTSKDPVVGNEQKFAAFWQRISHSYNCSPKLVGYQKRLPGHCKARWQKINDQVCKFVGCFEAAQRQKSSGQNDDDVMKVAYTFFSQDHTTNFNLEHAWRELRNDQKWCASINKGDESSKKRKIDETGSSHTAMDSDAPPMARPEGVKAAKAKAKAKGTVSKGTVSIGGIPIAETSELFQNMWTIKEKDFALQASQSKMSMLQSLLAKEEPLDEIEVALRKRLIDDFLSNFQYNILVSIVV